MKDNNNNLFDLIWRKIKALELIPKRMCFDKRISSSCNLHEDKTNTDEKFKMHHSQRKLLKQILIISFK